MKGGGGDVPDRPYDIVIFFWIEDPGRNSLGPKRAMAGCSTIRRVRRTDSTATIRSLSVERKFGWMTGASAGSEEQT